MGLSLVGLGGCTQAQQSQPIAQVEPGPTVHKIDHAMGVTAIEGTPQRVVVLTNEATDHLLALGLQPVGAVESWLGDPYYAYIQGEMRDVAVVGAELQPNLERIAALKPDLILGSKVRHAQIYGQLSAIAPTVFSETLGADWQENLRLYGQALNRQAEADQIMADWDRRIEDFQEKMGDRLQQEISLVRFLPGTARIYYEDNFAGRILKQIGFRRPPAQQKNEFADEVSYEQIALMDGDVLFYMTFDQGEGEASQTEQAWTSHPLWQSLDVVQANNTYEVNDVYWNTAGGVLAANQMLDDLYRIFLTQT
ncbi:iron-siderophore ABC transporter substrate-binding protein [Romeria aff. gracilis LEGE 07310]|uniref:Iron-siderophore ABC transporter substrate-binding protein n=1 Tax=Vasconcelosia minhoensis LEGE 07310 TaxID=915328 RepID=A0A8J7AAA4_9CYAN|nr:iron-siderophore ABC transporter substrate-binding protein [Romeria gracilis]MBE9075869.1 iron-siderophore ABC transporter substrate-binding protein [Romeria aff. gracilis LEGE 07310]